MKILFVTSEAHPFAKSGGLGDVAHSLPKALVKTTDIRVIMPKYTSIHDRYRSGMKLISKFTTKVSWREKYVGLYRMKYDKIPFYFIDNEGYFNRPNAYGYFDDGERFSYFSRAVIDAIEHMDFVPDIIHCNDWQSALIPVFLKAFYGEKYKDIKVVYTIHNLKFQGVYSKQTLHDILGLSDYYFDEEKLKFNDAISYMKGGITFSDYITTVSDTYANEIKYPFFGEGLHGLFQKLDYKVTGIVNGIDYETFNPRKDKELHTKYGISTREKKIENKLALQRELGLLESENIPVIGIVTRLTGQKGLDLIAHILEELLILDIQLVVLGTGDIQFEDLFKYYAHIYPSKLSANITFDSTLAKKIYAGSDMFLMPSLFEPCGLSQLISMRYGTIPIVRETGGLKDTVIPYNEFKGTGTGFGFRNYNAHELLETLKYALKIYEKKEHWDKLVKNAMERKSSWANAAKEYKKIYKELINKK
ncbi:MULTISPECIES: glycogen synthase GlgA [Psychrilyobacter]|uniref:Glycogen synthase n=1 Tax=Psychrilyobacter piezotolerans TaxID=2293438 RepID=A0ABX9KEI4_9FUSO|nr:MULTISPECIES: glycogen synthase GlgA [Psychrilyobacter]MCS5421686.1 glycogen synthase GlgA [Psychrilyobacter sp. S5]NDI78810.1 glycogen synthase GlgA [Psychrilyobacter piezotolerans]RDE59516.1 glycogen synthase GlgA [Psychrilyobacter sp. S5]REI39956.1 glycogen synthase GlgA [Psychrilyobacter piezotolerans]